MSTRKVIEVRDNAYQFFVIYAEGQTNPYRIYRRWYDRGEHRKLCMKYADLKSCLWWLAQVNVC